MPIGRMQVKTILKSKENARRRKRSSNARRRRRNTKREKKHEHKEEEPPTRRRRSRKAKKNHQHEEEEAGRQRRRRSGKRRNGIVTRPYESLFLFISIGEGHFSPFTWVTGCPSKNARCSKQLPLCIIAKKRRTLNKSPVHNYPTWPNDEDMRVHITKPHKRKATWVHFQKFRCT